MTAGRPLRIFPCPAPVLLCGLLLALASLACTRRSDSIPVQPLPAATPAPRSTPAEPAAQTPPKSKADAVDPDACKQARAELKRLQRQAAVGCTADNPCLTDRDCLLRTANANVTQIQDAQAAMEGVCPGSIDRLSCAETPATCSEGRCVAQAQ